MNYIFLLSKENIPLAQAEVAALAQGSARADGCLALGNVKPTLFRRLAYTQAVCRLLFSCPAPGLEKAMKGYEWKTIYKNSFCLRIHALDSIKKKYDEVSLAGIIWRALKEPKVRLEKSETPIRIYLLGKQAHVCLLLYENKKEFLLRKAHQRPELSPTSLYPRLARAMVNLTGITRGTITDPFCGTGGILLEAGLMGFLVEGWDIDAVTLRKCAINMGHYGIKKYNLLNQDATTLNKKVQFVVADLPYGKNSPMDRQIGELYLPFLKQLKRHLTKKAVLGFPDFVDYKKMLAQAGFKPEHEFTIYLHKTLSKKIVVVS
ncbi:N-6 DNA methylase [Candidatus Woesearchaeota archaeon]|nr:N-6 DNA methylase [Candidatus Woesearchaeota archaeon]